MRCRRPAGGQFRGWRRPRGAQADLPAALDQLFQFGSCGGQLVAGGDDADLFAHQGLHGAQQQLVGVLAGTVVGDGGEFGALWP